MARRKKTSARRFGGNIASVFTDNNNLRDLGYMGLGATLYALVPTALSRFFKVDMSGIKGVITGLASGLVASGFGGRGFAVFAGTFGAFLGHLWWTHLNGTVAYPIFGQYLWRWDPTAKTLGMQPAPQSFSDAVTGVEQVRLPNGKMVPVYKTTPKAVLPESKQTGLQDYKEGLADYKQGLADYQEGLADYQQGLEGTLSDPIANQDADFDPYGAMM